MTDDAPFDGYLDPGEDWPPREPAVAPEDAEEPPDTTPEPIEAHEPAVGLTDEPSPYLVGEWRGGPLYQCPECWFNARTHERVAEHARVVHTPEEPSLRERAARAGIVIASR